MKLLHIGCGTLRKDRTLPVFQSPEWQEIRLDIDPSVQPDVVSTMQSMPAIGSGSVQAIYSSHNVEHLYPHDVPVAFKEFRRVLSDNGFAVILCPDLQSIAQLIAEDKATEVAYYSGMGPITPLDMLFGHSGAMAVGNLFMAHHFGFTQRSLIAALLRAGFGSAVVKKRPRAFDLQAVAFASAMTTERAEALATEILSSTAHTPTM